MQNCTASCIGSSGESRRLLLSLAEVQEKKCSGSGKTERSCSVIHLVNLLAYLLLYYDFPSWEKKGKTCKVVWFFYVYIFLFCGELKDRVGLPLNPTVFSFLVSRKKYWEHCHASHLTLGISSPSWHPTLLQGPKGAPSPDSSYWNPFFLCGLVNFVFLYDTVGV